MAPLYKRIRFGEYALTTTLQIQTKPHVQKEGKKGAREQFSGWRELFARAEEKQRIVVVIFNWAELPCSSVGQKIIWCKDILHQTHHSNHPPGWQETKTLMSVRPQMRKQNKTKKQNKPHKQTKKTPNHKTHPHNHKQTLFFQN